MLLSAGCALPQKKANVVNIEKQGIAAITYPTELRGAYFVIRDDKVLYCAEPAPDIALDTLQKLASELSGKLPSGQELTAKIDSELSSKVVQLAGRTELILLAREMLYRACELTLNHPDPASTQKAFDMYMRVAELVENLGYADRALAEAERLKVSFGEDDNSKCIQAWLDKDESNIDKVNSWMKENVEGISISLFVYGKDYTEKRSLFIKQHNIQCN
jgi:hypothetical protein